MATAVEEIRASDTQARERNLPEREVRLQKYFQYFTIKHVSCKELSNQSVPLPDADCQYGYVA